eukprot:325423-Pleurochrysis_carterae.AAC.1
MKRKAKELAERAQTEKSAHSHKKMWRQKRSAIGRQTDLLSAKAPALPATGTPMPRAQRLALSLTAPCRPLARRHSAARDPRTSARAGAGGVAGRRACSCEPRAAVRLHLPARAEGGAERAEAESRATRQRRAQSRLGRVPARDVGMQG